MHIPARLQSCACAAFELDVARPSRSIGFAMLPSECEMVKGVGTRARTSCDLLQVARTSSIALCSAVCERKRWPYDGGFMERLAIERR